MWTKLYESEQRGELKIDWLEAKYVFSFAGFYNPERMGVGPLLVLNDDYIAPLTGFPSHPHRDMEIVTIALEGELHHKDSTGGHGVLENGSVQIMSAGKGIVHSEYNGGARDRVHSLQIWVRPRTKGLTAKYRDYHVGVPAAGEWLELVSPESVRSIDADVTISRGQALGGGELTLPPLQESYSYFLYVIAGTLKGSTFSQRNLKAGDALLMRAPKDDLKIEAIDNCDLLLFKLNESD